MKKQNAAKWDVEVVSIDSLKPHPQNYRSHPAAQLKHLEASLEQHGFYRNVVTARDGTILAGHGVVEAAKRKGLTEIPIKRLDIAADSVAAKKIIVADNATARLAEDNEDMLLELLKSAQQEDDLKLLGTGYEDTDVVKLTHEVFGDFKPATLEEQGKLDQTLTRTVACPSCGHKFDL